MGRNQEARKGRELAELVLRLDIVKLVSGQSNVLRHKDTSSILYMCHSYSYWANQTGFFR